MIRPALAYALLASALIVAACGLVYELVAGALASYLVGDTVTQFSTVIGTYLFAMGVGAWLAQHVRRDLLGAFVRIELLVGVLGGFSTLVLHAVFAAGHPFLVTLYSLVFAVGMLVGVEIPLLLRILRDSLQFEKLVSRVLSLDYLGALAACLLFPLWFVPKVGLMKTSLFFGLVNVAVAAGTLALIGQPRRGLWLSTVVAAALLGAGWFGADRMTRHLDRQMYAEPVVYHEQTPYQRIVVTSGRTGTSLHLNEHLQFNSADEYRYHEALVHPVMRAAPHAERALVLGGGDGLAVRELLRYPQLRSITLVDLDPAVTRLFAAHPQLASLNGGALRDPRVQVVNDDAWKWLERNRERYPVVIVDFPDPGTFAVAKLYTQTFYRLLARTLGPDGQVAIQATSPYYAREAYWCIVATLEAVGLQTRPYHTLVPSFGDWGFVIAGREAYAPRAPLPTGLRFLTEATFAGLFEFPADTARIEVEPNRLDTQVLVRYYEEGWARVTGNGS